MNGQPESEQLQNFHERLSKWVSSQGFWFQLRYSFSGGGAKGALAYHVIRLMTRFVVFLLVLSAGVWIYLIRQPGTAGYVEKLSGKLERKFSAEEIELQGFLSEKGEFYISRMAMKGGEKTFFSGMELKNLRCEFGILDQFKSKWDPGLIQISRAVVDLRAGADSQKSAKAIGDVLFQDTGRVKVDSIEVADISLQWGYSERTKGYVTGSKMHAQRVGEGWRLRFKGGTFTQNWLERMQIEEMEVLISKEGIVFDKAEFKKGDGSVSFTGVKLEGGERPEVSGKIKFRGVSLSSIVPVTARSFVEGRVSGELEVFGSTNSTDGIGFEGGIGIEDEDMIVLRERVHLLRALSVVDAFNSYRRVDFRSGSLKLKSHGGRLEIKDVQLKSGDLLALAGQFTVRQPTDDEAAEFVDPGNADVILEEDELDTVRDLTLRNAAEGAARGNVSGFEKVEDDSLFSRLGLNSENRVLEEKTAEQMFRSYRYEGEFTISLPKDAFARAPNLASLFPVSAKDGRVRMEVPIKGMLHELTLEQAEEIYKNGTRE